ncbi:mRNA-capping enzyme subunit alpha [Histoplasma capsulatum]|uniref:mRNA-capping enzyme subunit alpha n=1 Tax=Ajellomyces capsulatus TaxID=5037 RepID=A0A8A1MHH5_AJECA|nr:mRNA-capping enzyme subunit alpha [Histoplasma capsulatum]
MNNPTVPDLDKIGIKAEPQLADQFRREVAHLLGRTSLGFPGAQPVSFAARHILELQKADYYVCEKTDGIRCLLYFARGDPESDTPEIHYLIDRKNDYRYVPGLHFPLPDDDTFQSFHVDTIVDGELVIDAYEDGSSQLKFYVFDCLVLDGTSLMHRTLDKRLAYFKEKVLKPYNTMYKKYPSEKQHRAFAVEDKSTQFSYGLEMMFREIIPRVKKVHGNDGLIFTCRSTPYKIGTDENILKWKPPGENTVDFRMRLQFPIVEPDPADADGDGSTEPYPDYDAIPIFHLFVVRRANDYIPYGTMHVTEEEWETLKAMQKPLDDSIVECYKDEQHRWRFMRVMESIEDRVGEEDLIRAAPAIKVAWKRRQAEADMAKHRAVEEERRRRGSLVPDGAGAMGSGMNGIGTGAKRKFEE